MPKVIFWNIQRQGGGVNAIGAEELRDDLYNLAENHQPDVMVLCEGLKGLHKAMVRWNELPRGYESPKVNKVLGTYGLPTTLRYVLMFRSNLNAQGYLINTGPSRPALVVTWPGECVMALHAPSVTQSTTPQTDQMVRSQDTWHASARYPNGQPAMAPQVIFGDLNMNVALQKKRAAITGKLHNTSLAGYQIVKPDRATHRNANTGVYDTTLDWALCAPGVVATATAIIPDDKGNDKKRPRSGPTGSNKRQKIDHNAYSDGGDDDDFVPAFENTRSPDHRPILVEW